MPAAALGNVGIIAGWSLNDQPWGDEMNDNLRLIDALMQPCILDKDLSAPPGSPTAGMLYIVGPTATGAWATHEKHLALYTTAGWLFAVPKEGWEGYLVDENVRYLFDGTNWGQDGGAAKVVQAAVSDELTPLVAGTGKLTFRMPHAMTLRAGNGGIRASLTTAQASGSTLTVDVNVNGSSILSTKLTFDNTERTSKTAATSLVISNTALADDDEISIDIDGVGDGTATGLKLTFIGT